MGKGLPTCFLSYPIEVTEVGEAAAACSIELLLYVKEIGASYKLKYEVLEKKHLL